MKVFIGSSTSSKTYAEELGFLLSHYDCESINWWEVETFENNKTIIENLIDVFTECDAGLFLFSEDDKMFNQDTLKFIPRDNVIFEYGLFVGIKGRSRALIAKMGEPKLPVDFDGLKYVKLIYEKDILPNLFKRNNAESIKGWVNKLSLNGSEDLMFNKIINELRLAINQTTPEIKLKVDDFIRSLKGESLKKDSVEYHEKKIMEATFGYLSSGIAKSIFGVDVVGPEGWVNPSVYRYLAPQLREYFHKNINQKQFRLIIDERLKVAIENAVKNAKTGLNESYTEFDNPSKDFSWEISSAEEINLQYCRILLWDEEELVKPETEAVIIIHEAFHVPLFYLNKNKKSPDREDDFLVIEDAKMVSLCCCNSDRSADYKNASVITNPREAKSFQKKIHDLLSDENIMFAIDARKMLLENT